MRDFEYEAPQTLQTALQILAANNGAARPLAGGTDLIDHVRTGRHAPDVIVDIKSIPELNVLEISESGLRLGAALPCYRIYGNGEVTARYGALVDSCRIIGGIQIQNRASVGGNLCNSGPAADTVPALIAHSAVCVIEGPGGRRELPVEDFCTGPGQNVLGAGELLVELRLPAPRPHSGSHYRRFIPRNEMDIASAGVGASVVLDESCQRFAACRIGLAAVGPTPIFAKEASELLVGKPANDDAIRKAAAAAREAARPIDDMRGTVEFRRHVTGVLAERVLRTAVERAKGLVAAERFPLTK